MRRSNQRILPRGLRPAETFQHLLTISPMLMGLPTWVNVSRPGGISDASRMELLQSNHTRSRESILKLRDMRHILVFLNSTSLTCATMLSQHVCTCDGNTLPRSGAVDRKATVQQHSSKDRMSVCGGRGRSQASAGWKDWE